MKSQNGKIISACIAALALMPSTALYVYGEESLQFTAAANYHDEYQFKPTTPHAKTKVGLVLGGGGARGIAHIGVLRVLEREGIKVDYVAGNSIGSIVGGLYFAGVPLDKLQNDAESGSFMKKFMSLALPARILAEPVTLLPRLVGAKPYDGLYSGKHFRRYLVDTLPKKDMKVEDLKTPFAALSFNLLDGKTYMIRRGDLATAIEASSAVPGLRKPIEFDGKLLVDGGVTCNLPVKQCREMGADFVIAVNLDEPFPEMKDGDFTKLGSVSKRIDIFALWDGDKSQEQLADIVIHPDTAGIGMISRSKLDCKRGYLAGVKAAEDALPEIRRRLAGTSALTKSTRE